MARDRAWICRSRGEGAAKPAAALAALAVALVLQASLSGCAISPAKKELAAQWYGVGNAWLAAGKYAEAGKAYDRALAIDPNLIAASYNAARALVEAGSWEKALPIAKKLLEADPKNVRYISLEAWALWKAGRAAEAAAAYEAAYAIDPWAEDVVYNSSLLLLDTGKPEEEAKAVARLEPLVKARPDDKDYLSLYARALAKVGRDDDAVATLEDLRSMDGAGVPDLTALAGLYEKRGDVAKAIDALEAAVKKDDGSAAAWFALARLKLTRADDAEGGLDDLGKAISSGFKDKDAASALLSSTGLVSRDEVAKALSAAGLVAAAGTGVDSSGAGGASTSQDQTGSAPAAAGSGN